MPFNDNNNKCLKWYTKQVLKNTSFNISIASKSNCVIIFHLPVTECILIWMKMICKTRINFRPNEDDWKMLPSLGSIFLHVTEDVPRVIIVFTLFFGSILIIWNIKKWSIIENNWKIIFFERFVPTINVFIIDKNLLRSLDTI